MGLRSENIGQYLLRCDWGNTAGSDGGQYACAYAYGRLRGGVNRGDVHGGDSGDRRGGGRSRDNGRFRQQIAALRFQPDKYRTDGAAIRPGHGVGHCAFRRGKAIAEVHLSDAPDPGTHFDVGLIQEPRPGSGGCGPGDPGTAFSGMDTDAAGGATVTVSDTIRPGTTGVWVVIQRANPHSQIPAEFYTSEFVAPV